MEIKLFIWQVSRLVGTDDLILCKDRSDLNWHPKTEIAINVKHCACHVIGGSH